MRFSKNLDIKSNVLALFGLLLFVVLAAANNKLVDFMEKLAVGSSGDLAIYGGCEQEASPYLAGRTELNAKITYCSSGDADLQTVGIEEFQSDGEFFIYTSGYFGEKVRLVFNVDGEVVTPLNQIKFSPGEVWTAQKIVLPVGGKIKITLIDEGSSFKEWGGLSVPNLGYTSRQAIDQARAFFLLVVFFVASVAITSLSHFYVKKFTQLDAVIAPSIFLTLCCLYYLTFWVYYLNHDVGLIVSYLVVCGSVYTLFRSIFNGTFFRNFKSSYVLKLYLIPLLYVIVLFSFSIAYGDLASVQKTAASIFTHELPIDNFLPKIFADQIYHENLSRPMVGDWLSSDRPPLQTGQFLLFYKLFSGSDIGYQLVSMLLQAYCLVPLVLLLDMFLKEGTAPKFLIFVSLAFSSVILVNSIFVWPKLVAGTSLLFVTYILCNIKLFKSKTTPIIFSTALAMISLLAHSGSIFSLIPIAAISLFIFKPRLPDVSVALILAGFMFGPWLFYQKHIDPPGDRLVKWHLAGQIAINDNSLVDAITESYGAATSEGIVAAKVQNFKKMFEGAASFDYVVAPIKIFLAGGEYEEGVKHVKAKLFFNFFYSMGIIFILGSIASIVLIFRSGKRFLNFQFTLFFIASAVSLLLWGLLMFEAGSTVIHQGSYYPWIALMLIFSMHNWLAFKKMSLAVFVAHFAVNFSIYFISVMMYQEITNFLFFVVYLVFLFIFFIFSFNFFWMREHPAAFQEFVCRLKK